MTRTSAAHLVRVRDATHADVPTAAGVLADAFADYPWTRHTVAADRHGERLTALHRLLLEQVALPYGVVHVAVNAGVVEAVAVWLPPTPPIPDAIWQQVATVRVGLLGDRAAAAQAAEEATARLRPTTAPWLLATVGVRHHRQGHGLGRTVLAPGLRLADAERADAYLETSTAANVRFYTRLGFTVTGQTQVAKGLSVWAMVRRPATHHEESH